MGRLETRFGVEKHAELHRARLHNQRQNKGESLQELASDIRSMVDLAYQDVRANIQERFTVQHFVDALIDREDRLYLRREKPASLDKALALARELESLRLLDNSSAGNRDYKLRAIGAESAELKDELLELKAKILAQDKILKARQTLIKKLNELVAQEKKAQGFQTKGNQGSQGASKMECWSCGEGGHFRRNCPKLRQSSGNE